MGDNEPLQLSEGTVEESERDVGIKCVPIRIGDVVESATTVLLLKV